MSADAELGGHWQHAPSRLDQVLAELGFARSRSQAAELIRDGQVSVEGKQIVKTSTRVHTGSRVTVSAPDHYVSRGAHKLVHGLDEFGISVAAKTTLDVGASTGGFTQVLLERGAQRVLAIDVGHDQLAAQLRSDPRVHPVEGCNVRFLTREKLAAETGVTEQPTLVVADLSFISLTLVLEQLRTVASHDADFVLLIKPQFEVGRESLKEGIVSEPTLWAKALTSVLAAAAETGLGAAALTRSPIAGTHGNQEFLVHFRNDTAADQTQWREWITAVVTDDPAEEAKF